MIPIDIDDEFESFMRKVFPKVPITSSQWRESRKIFYCAILIIFLHFKKDLSGASINEFDSEMVSIDKQMRNFFLRSLTGKE